MDQFPWERRDEIRLRRLIARRWCQRRSQRGAAADDKLAARSLCLTTQTRAKTKEAYVYVRAHAHKLRTNTHKHADARLLF